VQSKLGPVEWSARWFPSSDPSLGGGSVGTELATGPPSAARSATTASGAFQFEDQAGCRRCGLARELESAQAGAARRLPDRHFE
jgi:hypothetical protein